MCIRAQKRMLEAYVCLCVCVCVRAHVQDNTVRYYWLEHVMQMGFYELVSSHTHSHTHTQTHTHTHTRRSQSLRWAKESVPLCVCVCVCVCVYRARCARSTPCVSSA